MKNETLNKIQNEVENNILKNEYSKAILDSIRDTFDEITEHSNKGDIYFVAYEFSRISNRTEVLLNLLQGFLQDSAELNNQTIKQIVELKGKESGDASDK